MTAQAHRKQPAVQFKGSLFTLPVLQLQATDLSAIVKDLQANLQQHRSFFQDAPIVLDLNALIGSASPLDLSSLVQELRQLQLFPVGIRSADAAQQEQARAAGLAVLPTARQDTTNRQEQPAATASTTANKPVVTNTASLVIDGPVRSGKQIYAQGRDLIVLSTVSPGAELLADGHIHVYGPLRGRALAGINGDTNARIFCQVLEAELVAIAGHYWVNEDLKDHMLKQSAHIYLENDHLKVSSL